MTAAQKEARWTTVYREGWVCGDCDFRASLTDGRQRFRSCSAGSAALCPGVVFLAPRVKRR